MILNRNNLHDLQPDKWDIRDGVIALIDKPLNWTSFDVVKRLRGVLRKAYGIKRFKVGHAGTLDPLASGLILVLMGKATKRQDEYMKRSKIYEASMELGYITASYDAETEKVKYGNPETVTRGQIEDTARKFVGEIKQMPPIFSALKVKGIPMYKYAREGKKVEVKERKVIIHDLNIDSYEENIVEFTVNCGSGTYIRSLAHDLGQELGCGAYLKSLRRMTIGEFNLEEALSVSDLISVIEERYLTS